MVQKDLSNENYRGSMFLSPRIYCSKLIDTDRIIYHIGEAEFLGSSVSQL